MKILALLIIFNSLSVVSLHAKVLVREVEGEAPIEVVTPPPVVVDEVKDYSYEGEAPSNQEFKTIEKGIESLKKTNVTKNADVLVSTQEVVEFVPVKVNSENSGPFIHQANQTVHIDDSYYLRSKGEFVFSFALTFADTGYDNLDKDIERGAFRSQFALKRMLNAKESIGVSLGFYHPGDKDLVVENTTMSVVRATYQREHFLNQKLYLFGGAGVNFADFNIRRTVYENENLITYKKILSGFAIGLSPEIGIRYTFDKEISFDLMIDYSLYFGEEKSNLGGFGLGSQLNFAF